VKRLGFGWPFLSAVKYQDTLASKGLSPLHCTIEVTSIAKAMKWPFHDICQVVHNFSLSNYAPLLDEVTHTIVPILCKDQLEILGKSLSLYFHAASEKEASTPKMCQVVIILIGSLSAALGATCSTGAPPPGHPPTLPISIWSKAADTPWDGDNVQLMPGSWSEEPAPLAAPNTSAERVPPGPAPKKGKDKGKMKPMTAMAPTPTTPPTKATPPHTSCPTSYAMATAQPPKPKPTMRPSLVISLRHSMLASNLKAQAQL